MKKGFTLIELLVVVLIIGILSAIAVLQYERAVERARAAEARIILNTIYRNYQLCKLENPDDGRADFHNFTIALPGKILPEDDCIDFQCFNTKDWQYGRDGDEFYANRVINADTDNYPYFLQLIPAGGSEIECFNNGSRDYSQMICGKDRCIVK